MALPISSGTSHPLHPLFLLLLHCLRLLLRLIRGHYYFGLDCVFCLACVPRVGLRVKTSSSSRPSLGRCATPLTAATAEAKPKCSTTPRCYCWNWKRLMMDRKHCGGNHAGLCCYFCCYCGWCDSQLRQVKRVHYSFHSKSPVDCQLRPTATGSNSTDGWNFC